MRLLVCEAFFKACADVFMAQVLAALDLDQAFLDFAHEPIVVVDQPFRPSFQELFKSLDAAPRRLCFAAIACSSGFNPRESAAPSQPLESVSFS
jgi:hypothetical protein